MNPELNTLLSGYPITIEVVVQWGDMDSFLHVNNTVYFRFFENARLAYMMALGLKGATELGPPVGKGIILAETSCRYKHPLTYPDTVSVGAKTTSIAHDRFTMEYVVVSQDLERITALGNALIVGYDYDTLKKAPLKKAWVQRMQALQTD